MARRVLAFFLGMIFGIVVLLGSIAGALYFAVAIIQPDDYWESSDKFLGDLASMSLLDIYKELSELYQSKANFKDDDGKYYSLGDFCEQYHINPSELFGKENVPQEVLDIPIFALFGENSDNALSQVKVSVIPALVNMFTEVEEGQSALFTQELVDALSVHSLKELFEENGFVNVFTEVKITYVLPSMFPSEQTEENELMWALGQASVGRLIGGMEGNILLEFKLEEGVFAELGKLPLLSMLGDSSPILSAILGDNSLADLIDDGGNLYPDDMLKEIYLGALVNHERKIVDDAESYTNTVASNEKITVKSKGEGKNVSYIIIVNGKHSETAYEASLKCNNSEHADGTHTLECFGFNWYIEGELASGIYSAIVDFSVGDLMSGDSSAIMDKFLNIKLKDLLGDTTVSGVVTSLMDFTLAELLDGGFDKLYFGTIFGYVRQPATLPTDAIVKEVKNNSGTTVYYISEIQNGLLLSADGKEWFYGGSKCDLEHEHTSDCYGYKWYLDENYETPAPSGIYSSIADLTIGDITTDNGSALMNKLLDISLVELLGDYVTFDGVLGSLKEMTLRELMNGGIDGIYFGTIFGFTRDEVMDISGYTTELFDDLRQNANGNLIKKDARKWYVAKLICKEEAHKHSVAECGSVTEPVCGKEEHIHYGSCYGFAWYNCTESHEHSESCYTADNLVDGVMDKLASKKVSELGNMDDTIKSFTLRDILGDDVPDMLKSIQDTKIGELAGAIEGMYLGAFFKYEKKPVTVDNYNVTIDNAVKVNANGDVAKLDTNGIWYVATLNCKETHEHTANCYVFEWFSYNCVGNHTGIDYNDECYTVSSGVMHRLARLTIDQLSADNLTATINDTPLGEVINLNDNSNAFLKELADVKIGELSNELDGLYVGITMGYVRNQINNVNDEELSNAIASDENGAYTIYQYENGYLKLDVKKHRYYEAELTCAIKDSSHEHNNYTCYGFVWYTCVAGNNPEHIHGNGDCLKVTGLNAKMSNLTMMELSGDNLTSIATSLTIGDLIDSKMIILGSNDAAIKENEYKLAILMCSDPNHKYTEQTILGDTSYACNLTGYFMYKTQHSSVTAEEFWNLTHEVEDEAHRNAWRELQLSEFINTLLSAM